MKPRYKTTEDFDLHFQQRISIDEHLVELYQESVDTFFQDPALVSDHALVGDMVELHSFSINGDYRVVYKAHKDLMLFVDIGTHGQVYRRDSTILAPQ